MLDMQLATPIERSDSAPISVWRIAVIIIALVVLVGLPFALSGYRTFQLSQVIIYSIALLGLNLLTGFNGQISLGHGAFFAIGGYTLAILTAKFGVSYWFSVPIAGFICFGAGFLFGFPALRLGGLYLALATFALALAVPQLLKFKPFDPWTGGVQGLILSKPAPPLHMPLTRDQFLYFFCLLCAALLFWFTNNLVKSRIGRAIVAIREHPIAAETMGVDTALFKTTTFGLSAAFTGVAGALSGLAVGFVAPDSFGLFLSLSLVVGIVVGGLGSIWGVFVGALFIEFVPDIADQISDVFGESAKALPWAIYGVLLIVIMYAAPSGAVGVARSLVGRVQRLLQNPRTAAIEAERKN
jgi:branched-chain amino acid transport system permease protein